MKKIILTAFFLASWNCAFPQKPETIGLESLKRIMEEPGNNIQVVNFWATWCAPCVKELPLFEKLNAEARENVKVTLISMDLDLDPNPEKVYRFVNLKKLQSEVFLLEAGNANQWINSIDKRWSGALPATFVINKKTGQRKFVGKELKEGDLEKLIAEVQ